MRRARSLSPLVGSRRLGGGKWEMGSGSGEYVRAAESWVAAISAEGSLRLGGGGTPYLGGGGAGVGLVGDATGFRIGTAGLTANCVRGRGGAAGGLSLRLTGAARRGGSGAELLVSFFQAGTGSGGVGNF